MSHSHAKRPGMLAIFLKTLPFFGLITLGYIAARRGFFSAEATAYLTKFVFYFALSAMLFRFSANLSLGEFFSWTFVWAYLLGTVTVYLFVTVIGMIERLPVAEIAVEAQCGVIGNVGFLGIPMLVLLLGEAAIGPVMLVLAVDLLVFGSVIVILITGSREGRLSPAVPRIILSGLARNPMIMSIGTGMIWSALDLPIPVPVNEFLTLLGAAATPCALFAIGASLAAKSTERIAVASYLTLCKLVLHPAAVAFSAMWLFPVDRYGAGVMVACAALPVAGNIFIVAQHYQVAPQRASAAIFLSTVVSVVTLPVVIAWVS